VRSEPVETTVLRGADQPRLLESRRVLTVILAAALAWSLLDVDWRDGVLHTALSGAEWARCTAAIAAALTADQPFAVIIPEERAYDAKTLAQVMRALSNASGQVILTSPVKPAGKTPAGWTVIDVEAIVEDGEGVTGDAYETGDDDGDNGVDSNGMEAIA